MLKHIGREGTGFEGLTALNQFFVVSFTPYPGYSFLFLQPTPILLTSTHLSSCPFFFTRLRFIEFNNLMEWRAEWGSGTDSLSLSTRTTHPEVSGERGCLVLLEQGDSDRKRESGGKIRADSWNSIQVHLKMYFTAVTEHVVHIFDIYTSFLKKIHIFVLIF